MAPPGGAALDPSAPVLVGVGAVQQRVDDPRDGVEAAALMGVAVAGAIDDAGATSTPLLDLVDLILVPEGTWKYTDPGRLVGAPDSARTVLANIGVLQQTLFTRACTDLRSGAATVALVVGGEAKHRALRANITGEPATETDQGGAQPDETLNPATSVLDAVEITRELAWPVRQYAIMDNALRALEGGPTDDQDRDLDLLWAGLAAVASGNPMAWDRTAYEPSELRPGATNPTLATPYTKRHNSQWNVDQAAALVLTTVATAERLGIDRSRWVFPWAGVESNHMVPLTERADLGRSPAMAVAGEQLAEATGVAADDVDHLDLYSCFPAAVRLQLREVGIDGLRADRPVTVTGGMAFAGGPLNNYALQALVAMAEVLRADPGSTGLVTSVSGMITKFGLGLWSTEPPPSGFASVDITDAVAERTGTRAMDPDYAGPATIAGWTVAHEKGAPAIAIVVADTPDGRRTLCTSRDTEVASRLATGAWTGEPVLADGASFTLG